MSKKTKVVKKPWVIKNNPFLTLCKKLKISKLNQRFWRNEYGGFALGTQGGISLADEIHVYM